MTSTSGSLSAAFESSGIKEVAPEPGNTGGAAGDQGGGLVIPPPKDPSEIQLPFIDEQQPPADQPNPETVITGEGNEGDQAGDGIDYFNDFAKALGLEEEVQGSSFEDFKTIGQKAIAQYKEKVESYENMFPSDLVEHIKAGGTVDTFYSYEQPTNNFQDVTFAEDDVETREAYLTDWYQNQGLEPEQIEMLIGNLKEKGTFNAQADKVLTQYKTQEKAENERIIAARKADEEESLKKRNEFISGVKETFEKGLAGVTVDKEVLEAAKAASLPDAKGQFGIHAIKLTPAQESTVNAFIVALTKGKSFSYAPTKATNGNNGVQKPISQIFNKQTNSGQQPTSSNTLEELNSIFGGRKN